jgi:hypothetical protein
MPLWVQPWDMVDKSVSFCEPLFKLVLSSLGGPYRLSHPEMMS